MSYEYVRYIVRQTWLYPVTQRSSIDCSPPSFLIFVKLFVLLTLDILYNNLFISIKRDGKIKRESEMFQISQVFH